jgi:hypothetical protein
MLPDFPKAKKKMSKTLEGRFRNKSRQHLGPFNQSPTRQIHEGEGKWILKRDDGSIDDRGSLKQFGVEIEIKLDEIEKMTFEDVLKKIDAAADEMGKKVSGSFYEHINEVTKETGNVVDAKGEPFSMDKFLDVLDKVLIDFKEDGEPELPTIVAGPELAKKITHVLSESESNPQYKARYDQIIVKKRQEWRDRENSRKLVG